MPPSESAREKGHVVDRTSRKRKTKRAGATRAASATTHAHGRQWTPAGNAFEFTPREVELAQCLFDTPHRPYIAKKLGISVKTVDTHLRRIFKKTGVDDHGDLILAVIHRALLAPCPKLPGAAGHDETPTA